MVRKISVKQGEAESQEFTILTNGSPVNVESAICTFVVLKDPLGSTGEGSNMVFSISNEYIRKSENIITVDLTETLTDQVPGTYYAELKVWFSATSVKKSKNITFIIEKSLTE